MFVINPSVELNTNNYYDQKTTVFLLVHNN